MDVKKIGMIAASTVSLMSANLVLAAGPTVVKDHFCQNAKCQGHSECAGMGSPAKGGNSCGGKGWLNKKSEAECTKAGGKWSMVTKEGEAASAAPATEAAPAADAHKAKKK
ncbi:MAG: hypothetical protein NTX25_15910 [Proteobacteria bacterium]|nr:hypothetical protein [Pseudomonadota bacterium]